MEKCLVKTKQNYLLLLTRLCILKIQFNYYVSLLTSIQVSMMNLRHSLPGQCYSLNEGTYIIKTSYLFSYTTVLCGIYNDIYNSELCLQ